MRVDPRGFGNNRSVDVAGYPPGFPQQRNAATEQIPAVGVLPAGVGVGVGVADVAEAGRAEQGVGDGVQHRVRVRVPDQTLRVRDADPAEDERPTFREAVRIVTTAHTE